MSWDPHQYHKFRDERLAPFDDLIALATFRPGMRIVDLGCGTGELTARLAELSPGAEVLGIDSSPAMLARAHPLPGLHFDHVAIEDYTPSAPMDVVFSHAVLQWIDDHPAVFARLKGFLAPGGQLLIQMPSNHEHISHRLVRELAAEPPWAERFHGFVRYSPVLPIDTYAELLYSLGFSRPIVVEKVYSHVLDDARAVLEWVLGTLLVPYLERLGPSLLPEFLEALGARYAKAMPARPYYFAFKRILIAATLPTVSTLGDTQPKA